MRVIYSQKQERRTMGEKNYNLGTVWQEKEERETSDQMESGHRIESRVQWMRMAQNRENWRKIGEAYALEVLT